MTQRYHPKYGMGYTPTESDKNMSLQSNIKEIQRPRTYALLIAITQVTLLIIIVGFLLALLIVVVTHKSTITNFERSMSYITDGMGAIKYAFSKAKGRTVNEDGTEEIPAIDPEILAYQNSTGPEVQKLAQDLMVILSDMAEYHFLKSVGETLDSVNEIMMRPKVLRCIDTIADTITTICNSLDKKEIAVNIQNLEIGSILRSILKRIANILQIVNQNIIYDTNNDNGISNNQGGGDSPSSDNVNQSEDGESNISDEITTQPQELSNIEYTYYYNNNNPKSKLDLILNIIDRITKITQMVIEIENTPLVNSIVSIMTSNKTYPILENGMKIGLSFADIIDSQETRILLHKVSDLDLNRLLEPMIYIGDIVHSNETMLVIHKFPSVLDNLNTTLSKGQTLMDLFSNGQMTISLH